MFATYYGLPICLAISTTLFCLGYSHSNFEEEKEHLLSHLFFAIVAGTLSVFGTI